MKAIFVLVASALVACTGADWGPAETDGGANGAAGDADMPAADGGATHPTIEAGAMATGITVNGTLVPPVGMFHAALPASVDVVVVDKRGVRQQVSSTGDGQFTVPNVQPPYDVSVLTPAGDNSGPTVVLGLSDASPAIPVNTEYQPPPPSTATFSLNVQVPSCPETSCQLEVASSSPFGSAETSASYSPGTTAVPISIQHMWFDTGIAENVTIQIMAQTVSGNAFWHSQISTIAGDGATSSFTPILQSAPVTETFTMTTNDAEFSGEWQRNASIQLMLPGVTQHGFPLAGASTLTAKIPNIVGAKIDASASLGLPVTGSPRDRIVRYVSSGSTLPLSTSFATVEFLDSPDNVVPAGNGTLQGKTGSFSWNTVAGHTAYLAIISDTGVLFSVLTSEKSIALSRLYALGIPDRSAGDHYLMLQTRSAIPTDDLVTSDPTKRQTFPGGNETASTLMYYRFSVE